VSSLKHGTVTLRAGFNCFKWSLSTMSFVLHKAPSLINVVLDSVDIQAQRRQTLRLRLSTASQRSGLASMSNPVQLWYLSNHNVLDKVILSNAPISIKKSIFLWKQIIDSLIFLCLRILYICIIYICKWV